MLLAYFYFTGAVIDVTEKYPCRARCLKVAEALGPLDDYSRIGIIENLFQS
jgi:hypothetical protein